MKRWKQILLAFAFTAGVGTVALPAGTASAINVFNQCGGNSSAVCKASGTDDASNMIEIIINTILLLLGMISVVMIIVGGIRYTISNGDASRIKAAKDTIMYAVVGLVVAILSYAIVTFVTSRF